MPSTLTGSGASVTQSTAPTAQAPSDGDSLAASSVSGPLQTLLNHIAKLWAGAFAAQGSNPALQATGSTTRAPLNLVPQAAPSAPADGDTWIETGTNAVKARIAGATQTLSTTDTATSHTWGGTQTFTNPIAGPSSTPVAITPDTNITASSGAAYWKDATNRVQLKGQFVNNTGAAASNWATVTPLPVGFRPLFLRQFTALAGGTATILMIGTDGTIKTSASVANGLGVSLDGVSFLAEQ